MNKITKLKTCDWILLLLTVAVLISGIQLEATHSRGFASVCIHMIIGLLFVGVAAYHILLHFGKRNWITKIHKQKSLLTRILWWVSLAMFITGITASVHWLGSFTHSPIGGIHGKSGFLMIIISAGHIGRRIRFFRNK